MSIYDYLGSHGSFISPINGSIVSPLPERAAAILSMRAARFRTDRTCRVLDGISIHLAELIDLGVDITRLDVAQMAEAGQRLRARAL